MRGCRYDDPVSMRRAGMTSALDAWQAPTRTSARHRRAPGARPVRRRGSRRTARARSPGGDDPDPDADSARLSPLPLGGAGS